MPGTVLKPNDVVEAAPAPVIRRRFTPRTHRLFEALEKRMLLSAGTGTIRVATYNMEADINGDTTPLPGFYQVLEGIGEEKVQGNVRPIDILGLEETTSNSTTIAPIVTNLNSYYSGAAVYAQSSYQATQNGADTEGNGPSGLIYNTLTLNLLASVGVGAPEGSSNGEYRQIVRYEFQPVGDTGSTGVFYVYLSHAKSGGTSADATDRNEEAQIVRNDEAANLPASASVIYMGDFNTSASTDASLQTFAAPDSPSGVAQGTGFDPINEPGDWDENSAFKEILTESATDLRYRDDLQLITQNVLNDTAGQLGYIAGSYHAFGNNGTTPEGGNVDSGSNTALNTDLVQDGGAFISASTLYADLTTGSDHLPVVADYNVPLTTKAGTPTIGSFTVSPTSVLAGNAATLTAGNVAETGGAGNVAGVSFYRESNGVTGLQIGSDTLIGAGAQNGATWTLFASSAGLSAGNYTYYAVAIDGNGVSSIAASASLIVASAPTLVSSQVGDGSRQRSTVSSVTVVFNEKVNFTSSSFTLQQSQDDSNWTDVSSDVAASNPSGDGITWVISCIAGGAADRTAGKTNAGFFASGIYQLTLHGPAITDAATGTAAFNGGSDQLVQFSFNNGASMKNAFAVLYGDSLGTGFINAANYDPFKNAFGTSTGTSGYVADLDYYGNGIINALDYGQFKAVFGFGYSFT